MKRNLERNRFIAIPWPLNALKILQSRNKPISALIYKAMRGIEKLQNL